MPGDNDNTFRVACEQAQTPIRRIASLADLLLAACVACVCDPGPVLALSLSRNATGDRAPLRPSPEALRDREKARTGLVQPKSELSRWSHLKYSSRHSSEESPCFFFLYIGPTLKSAITL